MLRICARNLCVHWAYASGTYAHKKLNDAYLSKSRPHRKALYYKNQENPSDRKSHTWAPLRPGTTYSSTIPTGQIKNLRSTLHFLSFIYRCIPCWSSCRGIFTQVETGYLAGPLAPPPGKLCFIAFVFTYPCLPQLLPPPPPHHEMFNFLLEVDKLVRLGVIKIFSMWL